MIARHAAVAALAGQAGNRARAGVLRSLPSGWRNVPSAPQRISYAAGGEEYAVAYRLPGSRARRAAEARRAADAARAGEAGLKPGLAPDAWPWR